MVGLAKWNGNLLVDRPLLFVNQTRAGQEFPISQSLQNQGGNPSVHRFPAAKRG